MRKFFFGNCVGVGGLIFFMAFRGIPGAVLYTVVVCYLYPAPMKPTVSPPKQYYERNITFDVTRRPVQVAPVQVAPSKARFEKQIQKSELQQRIERADKIGPFRLDQKPASYTPTNSGLSTGKNPSRAKAGK